MNILKTLRDGVHARRDDGDAPRASSEHAPSERAGQDPHAHEQPLVVGNGLPVKAKSDSGLTQRRET